MVSHQPVHKQDIMRQDLHFTELASALLLKFSRRHCVAMLPEAKDNRDDDHLSVPSIPPQFREDHLLRDRPSTVYSTASFAGDQRTNVPTMKDVHMGGTDPVLPGDTQASSVPTFTCTVYSEGNSVTHDLRPPSHQQVDHALVSAFGRLDGLGGSDRGQRAGSVGKRSLPDDEEEEENPERRATTWTASTAAMHSNKRLRRGKGETVRDSA